MTSFDRQPEVSVFIIGPMDKPTPDEAGVARPRLVDIRNAVELVVLEIKRLQGPRAENLRVRVEDPERRYSGSITSNVFSQIDTADLGIADITNRSPNVFYEYALMHSLGIPIIILDKEGAKPPFYCTDQQIVQVPNFRQETLQDALTGPLREFLFPTADVEIEVNPISKFYGTSLVDMAASTGLAAGQFYNFIRHIIMDHGPLSGSELSELVVIKPPSIQHVSETSRMIKEALPGLTREVIPAPTQARGEMTIQKIGKYIYDYPTPLEALTISPRYQRIRALIQRGEDPENSPIIRKLEQRMIDAYFRTLRNLAISEAGTNPAKLKFMSADEFIAAAQNA